MSKRLVLQTCFLAVFTAAIFAACTDSSTVAPRPGITKPLFSDITPFNNDGVCMNQDAVKAPDNTVSGVKNGGDATTASNCTSNDVSIATAELKFFAIADENGNFPTPTAYTGQAVVCPENRPIQLTMAARLDETASSERFDIGVWLATDGGNGKIGACKHFNLLPGSGVTDDDSDVCGDLNAGVSVTNFNLGTFNSICQVNPNPPPNPTPAQLNSLHIGSCIGWTEPGANRVCPMPGVSGPDGYRFGTLPGNQSKCNCGGFDVPITIQKNAKLEVKKVCDPTTDLGTFDLLIDGSTGPVGSAFGDNKTCGTGTGPQVVGAGTNTSPGAIHSFGEGDFTTGNYTSSYACTNRSASGPQHVFTASGDAAATGTSLGPNQITMQPNEDVICTYTNVRKPTLTIVKRVVNDNGGTLAVGDFGVSTNAGSLTFDGGVDDGANTKKYTSQTRVLSAAGTFSLHESDVAGYSEGTWGCTGVAGTVNSNFNTGSVQIAAGEQAVCTITNNDDAGSLQLIKRVVNDNGGTAGVSAFGLLTSGGSLTFDAGVDDGANTKKYTSNVLTVNAGSYTLRESDIAGYTEGTWSCTGATPSNTSISAGAVTVPLGTAVVCTITNDDQPGTLQLIKRVVNNNGGTAGVSAFGLLTSGGSLTFDAGVDDGANTKKYTSNVLTVNAGSYTLRESDISGYNEGTWGCTGATPSNTSINLGAVTVPNGGTVVCTITNDDVGGSLQIVKRVVNNNGGTATVANFNLSTSAGSLTFDNGVADGAQTIKYTSQAIAVNAGSYTLREDDITGYTEGTWSCTGATPSDNTISAGAVTVPLGGTVVCTITNDDQPGTLQLIKRVVNDNGGTAGVAAFSLLTSAGSLTFDAGVDDGASTKKYTSNVLTVNAASYTLRESDITGYTEGTWSCTGATPSNTSINLGAVTVPNGGSVVCTITNDDQPASIQLVKRVVTGGTASVAGFGLASTAGSLLFGAGVADGANTTKFSSQVLTVNAGSYTLRENAITGWVTGTWGCTGASPSNTSIDQGAVTVPNGGSVVCTITNTELGTIIIEKEIVGGGAQTFDFSRTKTAGGGSDLGDNANPTLGNGGTSTSNKKLTAGTYQVCENNVPVGWFDPTVAGYTVTSSVNGSGQTIFCVSITLGLGDSKTVHWVNSPPPGGGTRTIGYWKNWASCATSGGNQYQKAIAAGHPEQTLDGNLINPNLYPIGLILSDPGLSCSQAVNLLAKNAIGGAARPGDPIYNMVAQLLGAKLNLSAGAGTCNALNTALGQAQQLLLDVQFNGTGSYKASLTKTQQTLANSLNDILDKYNSGTLGGGCPTHI